MKEFLARTDDQTDPDRYWQDVVARYREYAHGKGEFVNEIFVQGIKELERCKCTKG